ncbi:rRNA accumulation- protein [Taxawa tesnikishii (nom. ined.)]|nr:rRNA accumulation- protein [Dothideales sp. JES 119]
MASANPPSGPRPAPAQPSTNAAAAEQAQAQFDQGIWYTLALWPALTIAVQNNWGGPNSSDKRDWFAGAVSDIFTNDPDTDALDLEAVLLQVMADEFDVNLEDESEVPVAAEILKIKKACLEADFGPVEEVKRRFETRKGRARGDEDDDDDDDDDEDEDEMDVDDAPALAPVPKEKPEPEVDEEGFTKVVGKKRR